MSAARPLSLQSKTFEEWGRILYDPVLASAILDRFVHHCNFIVINGDSFRLREREGSVVKTGQRGRPQKPSGLETQEEALGEAEDETQSEDNGGNR